MYPCSKCPKVCKSSRGLTQHISAAHSMVVLESMNSNVECSPSSEQLYPTMSLFNSVNEPYIIPPELSELDPDYHSSFIAGPSMLVTRKITSPSSVKSQSSKRAHNSDDHEKSSPKRVR